MSRKTITEYSIRLKSHRVGLTQLQQLSDSELTAIVYAASKYVEEDERQKDFKERAAYFLSELKRTGVTHQLLWQEYRVQYPDDYTRFCILLAEYANKARAVIRLDYRAAEVVMVDFAGDNLSYVDKTTGEVISCPVLVCVLPYSGYSFVKALPNATMVQLISTLNDLPFIFWQRTSQS